MNNSTDLIGIKNDFYEWLVSEERSKGTIEKYMRDISNLYDWLGTKEMSKDNLNAWKESLIERSYKPNTINSMLASINTYCRFLGLNIKMKFFRIQKKIFIEKEKELSKDEYIRLVKTAENKNNKRLALIMETIGSTGIRVSELQYITVEALHSGRTQISLKGKIRDIMIPKKLCIKLLSYAKAQKIKSGMVFITKNGNGVSRRQIWYEMKSVCKDAKVEASKVFPHNLRHLFARVFYKATKDIAKLADILGHSSIETTRIYLLSTGTEHAEQLERLELVQ